MRDSSRVQFTEETLEEARLRYQGERFVYMTRNPEIRLQLDADACHDVAADFACEPMALADALGLSDGIKARIKNPAIELDYVNCSWRTF